MSTLTNAPIPAAWYPDPEGSPQQRWWDGSAWSKEVAPYNSVQELVDAATRATEVAQSRRGTVSAFTSAAFVSTTPPTDAAVEVPAVYTAEIPAITPANAREIKALEAAVALHGIPVHDRDEFIPLDAAAVEVAAAQVAAAQVAAAQAAAAQAAAAQAEAAKASAATYAAPMEYPAAVSYSAPVQYAVATDYPAPHVYAAPALPVVPRFDDVSISTPTWNQPARPTTGFSSGMSMHDAYEHFASVPNVRFTMPLRASKHATVSAFLLALLPVLATSAAVGGAMLAPRLYSGLSVVAIIAAVIVCSALLALRDSSTLRAFGHLDTASWRWALVAPLAYLVARTIAVKRETGTIVIAPLAVAGIAMVAIAGVVLTQPTIVALLTGASL